MICRNCGREFTDGVDGKGEYCFQCWMEAKEEINFRYGLSMGGW